MGIGTESWHNGVVPAATTKDRLAVSMSVPRRRRQPHNGWLAVVVIFCVAAVLLPLIAAFGSYRYVLTAADYHDATATDAIVVLGAAQFDGRPSPVLRARLQHAKELVAAGVAPRVITVGGRQSGDRFTEAGAGRDWLIAQGIPSQDVIAVEEGHNTVDSLTAVAQRANESGWQAITIDTDPAHIARSMAIAHHLGFEAHGFPTQSGDGSRVTDEYVLRETSAYLAFEALEQWDVPRIIER